MSNNKSLLAYCFEDLVGNTIHGIVRINPGYNAGSLY
jgi:hypothetical protein